jgi:hypothetical protein
MPEFRLKNFLPPALALILALGAGAVFLLRPPVLIVTDGSFRQLYGERRLRDEGLKTSFGLFRRVIPLNVSENAGPDLVVLTVEGYGRPGAVIFPYRYLEAARLYSERHEDIPALVSGEGNRPPLEPLPFSFIRTDSAADLYRAGLCAALLAGEKQVLFLGSANPESREQFLEGLGGREPVFADSAPEISDFSGFGCVVAASKIPEMNLDIPIVLFSWLDPAFTPSAVKLIFDDSPWALAGEALRTHPRAGETPIASKPRLLRARIGEKAVFKALRACLAAKSQKS